MSFEFCYRVRKDGEGDGWTVWTMFPPPTHGTPGWNKKFASFDALPDPIKEHIALLDLSKSGEAVEHVGHKHESQPPTYWVYTDHDCFEGEK